jgi:tRNA-dihydrouridine synthase B
VIGSGDVKTGSDALKMFTCTGCAGIMVGRGALGKPWIFDSIHAYITGTADKLLEDFRPDLVQMHLELLSEYLPGRRSVGHLRKHLGWYSKGWPGGSAFRKEINQLLDPLDIVKKAEDFFVLKA